MPVTIKNVTAPAAATWAGTKTFKVNGETDLTVYTQNGAPWAEQEFVGGATGDITGYAALYKGAPQIAPRNINDIAAFMGEPSTDPSITVNPTSLTFAAAGEAKTVTVTKKNADDCTIEASADNEQFTVEVSGDQVNVTAKENTAEEAISGTLTVKLMKAGEAVATATVKLTQSGVISGDVFEVTFTADDIKAQSAVNSYADYTLSNSFGEWVGKGIVKPTEPFIQMNFKPSGSALNSRIITPELGGVAQKIVVEFADDTFFPRGIGIYDADYLEESSTTATVHDAAAKAISEKTQAKGGSVSVDLSELNLTRFAIFPSSDGAIYIKSITITCKSK